MTSLDTLTTVANPPRTILAEDQTKASHETPIENENLSKVTHQVMSEVIMEAPSNFITISPSSPWLRPKDLCSGVIWASVHASYSHWSEGNNGHVLSLGRNGNVGWHNHYLRLIPAPDVAPGIVQYGFCPLRVTRLNEKIRCLRLESELQIRHMPISASMSSKLRSDKMVDAALGLFLLGIHNPTGVEFKSLLGRRSIRTFIARLLKHCYSDSYEEVDILHGTGSQYVQLVSLVAQKAFPNLLSPQTRDEFSRFIQVMGFRSLEWKYDYVYPYHNTVTMPRPIFEANVTNLEAGIPSILPHYITPANWMFNGPHDRPCTGLSFTTGLSGLSKKIIAGVGCVSNTDLVGRVSYWDPPDNPPQEWVDSFVRCIESLRHISLPRNEDERHALVLREARRIPIMFRCTPDKFIRVTDLVTGSPDDAVSMICIRECSSSGNEWTGSEVRHNYVGA